MGFLVASAVGAVLLLAPGARARSVDGDCNGSPAVTAGDVLAIAQRLFDERECGAPDANGDGRLTAADVAGAVLAIARGSPEPLRGPRVTFFGLAAASGRILSPSALTPAGIPVYMRTAGTGFQVVLEAAPGPAGAEVGLNLFDLRPGDPSAVPDLQVLADRALGNGSPEVCDLGGGVPAVPSLQFENTLPVASALNDLACRFLPATTRASACTLDDFDILRFASAETTVQFCLGVSAPIAFPPGDTTLVGRVRDRVGNVGPIRALVVRVSGGAFTPSATTTAPSPTRSPTSTRTAVSPSRTPSPPPTTPETPPRGTPTSSPTRTLVAPTPSYTPSPTRCPTARPTSSRTPSATATATVTPSVEAGPRIAYLGLISQSGALLSPVGTTPEGLLVFQPPTATGSGFGIVIEARPGPTGSPVGIETFRSDPADPTVLPDLQVQVDRPIGDGSPAVCDNTPPFLGGVPAVRPPSFAPLQSIADAINDLACRFVDGQGRTLGRPPDEACVRFPDGEFHFVSPDATVQFCWDAIPRPLPFPPGDTLLTARVRDRAGAVGPATSIVIRIAP